MLLTVSYDGVSYDGGLVSSNPLIWWKGQEPLFPLLRAAALKHLSTPCSSVYSERLFSEAGTVWEEKRSRLLPARGEKLLFLHHNAKKF